MAAPGAEPPCGLCGAAAAPYTCPRCNRRLCSLRCYRGHGACAEAFYRQQVLQALEAEPGPPGLGDTFRRLQELREPGDPAGPEGLDLWRSLSPAERAEFQRLLSSGEAAALLPPWRPWWWRGRARGEEEEGEEDPAAAPPPPLPAALPALSSFPAPPPSPLLPFQLPNVLYGYAFALALHRGDETLLPELPAAAIDVSAALRSRCPFPDAAAAIRAARRDAAAAAYPPCPLGEAGTVLAVAELLEGSVAGGGSPGGDAGVALAHLGELLRRGERGLRGRERVPFARARKKCWFLLAWMRQEPAPRLEELGRAVRRLVSGEVNEGLVSGEVDEGPRGRRLIQELE
ncbi:zinc finger hit domain-containing protein 2 [Limosa lapponica baueri]|uniref:Zinc finger hit domain-containing protein 2 n=1 Tax=Limosa lapponica baueri TaxID=1758121 RepID=A0A2I0T024_LIMLA|nr:zinc finger hit domain-containing protein 2 [Limosa lapponica baueri]